MFVNSKKKKKNMPLILADIQQWNLHAKSVILYIYLMHEVTWLLQSIQFNVEYHFEQYDFWFTTIIVEDSYLIILFHQMYALFFQNMNLSNIARYV